LPLQKKLLGGGRRSRSGSFALTEGSVQGEIVPVRRASFLQAFPVLLHRSWLNFSRQPLLVMTRVLQVLAFGVILALYYARLGDGQASVQNRMGLLQEFTALMFIGLLNCVALYPAERDVFYREYADRSYGSLPFLLSYTLGEVVFELFGSVIFVVLTLYAIGMSTTAAGGVVTFFVLLLVTFCIVHSGESFGLIFCSLVPTAGISVSVTNALMTFLTVMVGVYSLNLPGWLRGLNYASVLRFGVRALARQEFEGLTFTCAPEEELPTPTGPQCPFTNGEQVLELYEFNRSDSVEDLLCLVGITVGYRLIAFATMALAARKKHFAA